MSQDDNQASIEKVMFKSVCNTCTLICDRHFMRVLRDNSTDVVLQITALKILDKFITLGRYMFFLAHPCQRQGELLPSLGVHRLSSVNFSHFNLLL